MGFNLGTSGNSNKLSMTDFLGGANNAAQTAEREIDINALVPWENQPFKMYSDLKLNELANSIKENGLLSPIIVCPIKDDEGKYRIIAGHNRVEACRLLGMTSIPSIVKDVDENRAKLMMADTNLCQRTELLPSERAYAYKAQQEALQALGSKRATADIADNYNEDRRTIQRYIACARLCPELMDMLDSGRLIFAAAVKLSGLALGVQETIGLLLKEKPKLKISAEQAGTLADELGEKQYINSKKVLELLTPHKDTEKAPAANSKKITLNRQEVTEIIGEDMSNDDITEAISEYSEQPQSKRKRFAEKIGDICWDVITVPFSHGAGQLIVMTIIFALLIVLALVGLSFCHATISDIYFNETALETTAEIISVGSAENKDVQGIITHLLQNSAITILQRELMKLTAGK